jgi:hypothetical protein
MLYDRRMTITSQFDDKDKTEGEAISTIPPIAGCSVAWRPHANETAVAKSRRRHTGAATTSPAAQRAGEANLAGRLG